MLKEQYDIESIIKSVYYEWNIPIYKEDIELVQGIIHLRKVCPVSYKRTAFVKILNGRSTQYTKDSYYGFALKNKNWMRKGFLEDLIDCILNPLYELKDIEINDENFELVEYMCSNEQADKMQLMLIELKLNRIINKYNSSPDMLSEDQIVRKLPSIKIQNVWQKIGADFLFNAIQNLYNKEFDSEYKDIKYRYYSGNMTYVEFFIKNYIFKIYEARCKCTENTRTYSFQVPMYKYKLKTNKAYFYNIFVTFDKEFNVINTEFKLTEDKDWIYIQLKGNNNEYLNEARFGDHFYFRWGSVEWNSDINEQIRIWSNDLILKAD